MKKKSSLHSKSSKDIGQLRERSSSDELFDNLIQQEEWLTADEASDYIKVSKSVLYNMCSSGELAYYKMGKSRRSRFLRRDLDELLLRNRRGGFK